MFKLILSVVLALVVSVALILGIEMLGGILFKLPMVDPKNQNTIYDMMKNAPLAFFIWLMVGYSLGSLVGGALATYISGRVSMQSAIIVGCFLLVSGLRNMLAIPHPMWFMITSTIMYIPFAWLGYMIAKKKAEVSGKTAEK
jgi:hypothetical protein